MIFIIDDHKNVLRGFQILFKAAALVCCTFDNVEEFLSKEFYDQNKFKLINGSGVLNQPR